MSYTHLACSKFSWHLYLESRFLFKCIFTGKLQSFCQSVKLVSLEKVCCSAVYCQTIHPVPLCSSFIIIIINPLTTRVVGAPWMILQPVFSIFPCSPLPSGTWRTPGLSIPWCCLPNSSSIYLVFFPLSLCLARWFWPDLRNGKHDHTTAVCVSLQSSGGLPEVQLPAGSWHGSPSLVTWSLYEMCSILQ